MQALCGGCAMVINGVPALACNTFADEVKGEELVLAPLSKFPVVADLIVDRSVIYENLTHAKAYLDTLAANDKRQHKQQERHDLAPAANAQPEPTFDRNGSISDMFESHDALE